jgi:hypothetical protein
VKKKQDYQSPWLQNQKVEKTSWGKKISSSNPLEFFDSFPSLFQLTGYPA